MNKSALHRVLLFTCVLLFTSVLFPAYARDRDELERLDRYIAEGKKLYGENYYMGAIEKWTAALAIAPWNDEVKSLIERALNRYEELSKKVEEAYDLLDAGDIDGAYTMFLYASENSSHRNEALYDLIVRGIRASEERKNKRRFQKIIEIGDGYLANSRFDDAENLFNFARKFNPGDPLVSQRLASLSKMRAEEKLKRMVAGLREKAAELFEQGGYEESKKLWNEVRTYVPGDMDAALYLSKISYKERERQKLLDLAKSYFKAGMRLFKESKYRDAIDQFEDAVAMEYSIEGSKKMIVKALDAIEAERKAETERNIQKVLGHLREGIKFYNLGRYRDSLQALNKGLSIDPENTQIREYMLRDTIALRKEEEKVVSAASPFYPLVQDLTRLGLEAFARGDYEEAVKRWEEILLIFPFNEEARKQLTRTLARTDPSLANEILAGQYRDVQVLIKGDKKREAVSRLKLILEVNPGFRDAGDILRKLESEQKEKETAVAGEDMKRAQEAYTRGLEYYREEKLEEALKECKKAVELNPEFVDARVFLASVETKLHNLMRLETQTDRESAVKNSEMKIKLKRHYMDGINFYLDGMYREAVSEWEEVVKMDPDYENVRANIKRAKERLKYEKNQSSS